MNYDEARDKYGTLGKYERYRILDLVSQYTDKQTGPEAEAAFVRAVQNVTDPFATGGIVDFTPYTGIFVP